MDTICEPVILDCGSFTSKIGLASHYDPFVFSSVVGWQRYLGVMIGLNLSDFYVGNEAQRKRGILRMKYPIEKGIITNWDDMEKIWQYSFYNELGVKPEEHFLLLTDDPLNPKANREKVTEIMFEKFATPAMYIANKAVLSLYASARVTGIVLDSGYTVTRVIPIFGGYTLSHKTQSIDIGGRDLTEYLIKLMSERGYSFSSGLLLDTFRDIKEKLCYVSKNPDEDTISSGSIMKKNYELPDGQIITLDKECYRATNPLFSPACIGLECYSIQQLINTSAESCDIDIRKQMYDNIVLSGGSTLIPGFAERIQKEVSTNAPSNIQTLVHSDISNKYSTWLGGTILASMSIFKRICMTKSEFDEHGPVIINRKYF